MSEPASIEETTQTYQNYRDGIANLKSGECATLYYSVSDTDEVSFIFSLGDVKFTQNDYSLGKIKKIGSSFSYNDGEIKFTNLHVDPQQAYTLNKRIRKEKSFAIFKKLRQNEKKDFVYAQMSFALVYSGINYFINALCIIQLLRSIYEPELQNFINVAQPRIISSDFVF